MHTFQYVAPSSSSCSEICATFIPTLCTTCHTTATVSQVTILKSIIKKLLKINDFSLQISFTFYVEETCQIMYFLSLTIGKCTTSKIKDFFQLPLKTLIFVVIYCTFLKNSVSLISLWIFLLLTFSSGCFQIYKCFCTSFSSPNSSLIILRSVLQIYKCWTLRRSVLQTPPDQKIQYVKLLPSISRLSLILFPFWSWQPCQIQIDLILVIKQLLWLCVLGVSHLNYITS